MEMDIEIDPFTPCLIEVSTGNIVATTYRIAEKADLVGLNEQGWLFDWNDNDLKDDKIYKLLLDGSFEIQGLIAIKVEIGSGAVYARLAENSPKNRGVNRQFKGVGGHLFAIAAQKSQETGLGGFVYLDAKNRDLVEHYAQALGAKLLGMPHPYRMIIDEDAAAILLMKYTLRKGDS